jgi:peptidoglycan/LPS O-acetylase OafA/YrhL
VRHFFIGRIFRLYPAVIFMILLFSVIFWTTGAIIPGTRIEAYQPLSIVRNILLIDWFINGVTWSLTIEAIAIPLIFAVTIGQQRLGGKLTLLMAILLLAPSIGHPYRYLINNGGFVTFFYAFVLGIGTHRIGPQLIDWIRRRGLRPWFVATMLILFFVPRANLGGMSRWARFAECIAAAGLIAVLVYGPAKTNLSRVLNLSLFRFYGRMSYSFYLLHPITLMVLWAMPARLSRWLDAGIPAVLICLGLTIASVAAITPLAWLSWRFIEIPGIAAGRRLSPDRRNASPYVGAHGQLMPQTLGKTSK